jgi:hypothetical protein
VIVFFRKAITKNLQKQTDLEIFLIHICAGDAKANKFVLFESLSWKSTV